MGILDFLLSAQAQGSQEPFDPFRENEFADIPAGPQFQTTTQPPQAPAGGLIGGGVTPRPMSFGPAPAAPSGTQGVPPITQGGFFGIPTPGPLNEFFNPGIGSLQREQISERDLFKPGGALADVPPATRNFLLTHPKVLARELQARQAAARAGNKPLTRFQKETFRRADVELGKEDAQHQSRVELLDNPDGIFSNMPERQKAALRGSPEVLKELVEDRLKNPPGPAERKAEVELKLKELELKSRKDTGFKGPEQIAAAESTLRKDFVGLTKGFRKITNSFAKIRTSGNLGTGPGDIALIFNFMKMLDEESVVRESEFATAQNTGSIPERLWAQYNRMLRGERLSPSQRKKFIEAAEALFKTQSRQFGKTRKTFQGIATRMKLNPDNVALDFGLADVNVPGAGTAVNAPPAAVQFLRQNVNDADVQKQFIQKFGEKAFFDATANQGPQQ